MATSKKIAKEIQQTWFDISDTPLDVIDWATVRDAFEHLAEVAGFALLHRPRSTEYRA